MSLWRVKHTMSPIVEAALVGTVAAYGLFAIWYASLSPLAISATSLSGTQNLPVSLDVDDWARRDAAAYGYAYAVPPGWLVDETDAARIRLGRSSRELALAGLMGDGLIAESITLSGNDDIAVLAAADFVGQRPALYDVSVDGRASLFAVAFQNGRVSRQAVYVPDGKTVLVIRAMSMEPALFATFVSTIKFYAP